MSNALTIIMGEEGSGSSGQWSEQCLLPAPPHPVHPPSTTKAAMYTGAGYASEYKGTGFKIDDMYIEYDTLGLTPSSTSNQTYIIKKLTETTALVVINSPSASANKSTAAIMTFDQNNPNSVSIGPTTTLFSGSFTVFMGGADLANHQSRYVKLNTAGTVGIFWGYDSVNAKLVAQAFTIGGIPATVSVGATTIISSQAHSGYGEEYAEIVDISSGAATKFLCFFKPTSAQSGTVLVAFSVNVNSRVITVGTSTAGQGSFDPGGIGACSLGTDKALIAGYGGTNSLNLAVVTVSGTTITLNTAVGMPSVTLSTFANTINLAQFATDKAIITWTNGTTQYAGSVSVSGTVPTGTNFGTISTAGIGSTAKLTMNPRPIKVGTDTFYILQYANNNSIKGASFTTVKVNSSGVVTGSAASTIAQNASSTNSVIQANSWDYSYCTTTGNVVWYVVGESQWIYNVACTFNTSTGGFANVLGSGIMFTSQNVPDNAALLRLGVCQISDSLTLIAFQKNTDGRAYHAFHNSGLYSLDMLMPNGQLAGWYNGSGFIITKGIYTSTVPLTQGNVTAGTLVYSLNTDGTLTTSSSNSTKIGRLLGDRILVIGGNFVFGT
jgi:hypothetical protein